MSRFDTSMGGDRRDFPATSWTLVARAANDRDPEHLQHLIRLYWKPVYAYVRALRRRSVEDAKDLTQDFFTRLLEKGAIAELSPERGSFRGFLRRAVKNFVIDAARREKVRRPQEGRALFPLDEVRDEEKLPEASGTPDERFDREWDRTVLHQAIEELDLRLRREGLKGYVEPFRDYALAKERRPTHAELAATWGVSESTIRNRLAYCLRSLRDILRERVRDYVADEKDVEAELRRVEGE